MKQKTINILVFISLAFNIAFIGSYFYHTCLFSGRPRPMMGHPMPPPMFKDKFAKVMQNVRPEQQEFMQASHLFFQMITNPEIGEEEVTLQLEKVIAKQMQMEKKIGSGIISIRQEMTAEELQEAGHFFENRRNRFKEKRFDHNMENKEKPKRREK